MTFHFTQKSKRAFSPITLSQGKGSSSDEQSGFQSGLKTAPLAAVIAGYCNSLSHFKLEVVLSSIFPKMFFTKNTYSNVPNKRAARLLMFENLFQPTYPY